MCELIGLSVLSIFLCQNLGYMIWKGHNCIEQG